MKREVLAAAVLGLACLAGCDNTNQPEEIEGTPPATTGDRVESEAGGATGGGDFTANPSGEIKPSEVPEDYPKPAGVTPRPADESGKTDDTAKPADDTAKPADDTAKPVDETAKPADEEKAA